MVQCRDKQGRKHSHLPLENIRLSCTRIHYPVESSTPQPSSPHPITIPSTPPSLSSSVPESTAPFPDTSSLEPANRSLHRLVDMALLPLSLDIIDPSPSLHLDAPSLNPPLSDVSVNPTLPDPHLPQPSSPQPSSPSPKDPPSTQQGISSESFTIPESWKEDVGRSYPLRKRNAISLHPYTLLQWTRPETIGKGHVDRRAVKALMNEPLHWNAPYASDDDDVPYVEEERAMSMDPEERLPELGEKRQRSGEVAPRKRKPTYQSDKRTRARRKKAKVRLGRKGGMNGVLHQLRTNETGSDDDEEEDLPLSKLFRSNFNDISSSTVSPLSILRRTHLHTTDDDEEKEEEEEEEKIRRRKRETEGKGGQGKRTPWVIDSDEEDEPSLDSPARINKNPERRWNIDHEKRTEHEPYSLLDEAIEVVPIISVSRPTSLSPSNSSKQTQAHQANQYSPNSRFTPPFSPKPTRPLTHQRERRSDPTPRLTTRRLPRRITAKSLMGKLPASFIRLNNLDGAMEVAQSEKKRENQEEKEEEEEVHSDDSTTLPLARDRWVIEEEEEEEERRKDEGCKGKENYHPLSPSIQHGSVNDADLHRPSPRTYPSSASRSHPKIQLTIDEHPRNVNTSREESPWDDSPIPRAVKRPKTYASVSRRAKRSREKKVPRSRSISRQARPYLAGLSALAEASRSYRSKLHEDQGMGPKSKSPLYSDGLSKGKEDRTAVHYLRDSALGQDTMDSEGPSDLADFTLSSTRSLPFNSIPMHPPSSSAPLSTDPFPSFLRIPYRRIRQRIASSLPIRMDMRKKVIQLRETTREGSGKTSRPPSRTIPSGKKRCGRKVMRVKSTIDLIHDRRAMMLGSGRPHSRGTRVTDPVIIEEDKGYVNAMERWLGYLRFPSEARVSEAPQREITSTLTLPSASESFPMKSTHDHDSSLLPIQDVERVDLESENLSYVSQEESVPFAVSSIPDINDREIPGKIIQFEQAVTYESLPLIAETFYSISHPFIPLSPGSSLRESVIDWMWTHMTNSLHNGRNDHDALVQDPVMEALKALASRFISINLTLEEIRVRKGVQGTLSACLIGETRDEGGIEPRILEQMWKLLFLCHALISLDPHRRPCTAMNGWVEALLTWTLKCRQQAHVPEDPGIIYTALAISQAIYSLWNASPLLLSSIGDDPLPTLIHLLVPLVHQARPHVGTHEVIPCIPGDVLRAAYRLMEHRRFRDYHGEDERTGKDRCFSLFLHLLQGYLEGVNWSQCRIAQGQSMTWGEEDVSEGAIKALIIRLIPTVMFVFPDPILPYDPMYSASESEHPSPLIPMTDTDGLYDLSSLSNVLSMFCTLLHHAPLSLIPAVSQRWSRTLRFREAGWAARTLALEGLASAERILREDRRVGGGDPLVQYALNAAVCLVEEDRRRGGIRGRVEGMILLEKCLTLLEVQRDQFGEEVGGGWEAWENFHSALWTWFGSLNLIREGDRGGVEEGIINQVMSFGETMVRKMLPASGGEGSPDPSSLARAGKAYGSQSAAWVDEEEEEEEEGMSQEEWLKAVMAHTSALEGLDISGSSSRMMQAIQENEGEGEGLRRQKIILKDWMYPAIRGIWDRMMGVKEGGLVESLRHGWEWSQRRGRRARVGRWLSKCLILLVQHQIKGWEAFLYPYSRDAWRREGWRMGMRAEWARVVLCEILTLDPRVIKDHEEICILAWIDSAVVALGGLDEEEKEVQEEHERLGTLVLGRQGTFEGHDRSHWSLEWMIDQVAQQSMAWVGPYEEGERDEVMWQGQRRSLQEYILAILKGMTQRLRELRETHFIGYQAVIASYHDACKGIARRILQVAPGILLNSEAPGSGEGVGQSELLELLGPGYLASSLATRDWTYRLDHLLSWINAGEEDIGWDGLVRRMTSSQCQSQLVSLWKQLSQEGSGMGDRVKVWIKRFLGPFTSDQHLHDAERGWGLRVFLYQSLLLASAKDPGGHGMKPCVNVCKGLFHLSLLPRIELALHGDQRTRYTVWVEWACILQVSLVALPSQEERNAWYLSPEQEGSWKRGIYRRKRLMGALDMAECLLRQGGHIWISSRMLEWRPRMIEYVDRVKRVIKDLRMLFNGEHRMDAELGEGRMEFFVPRAHRLPQSIVQEYVSQLEVENGVDRAEGERTEEEEEEESGYMGEDQGRTRVKEQLDRIDRLLDRWERAL